MFSIEGETESRPAECDGGSHIIGSSGSEVHKTHRDANTLRIPRHKNSGRDSVSTVSTRGHSHALEARRQVNCGNWGVTKTHEAQKSEEEKRNF